MNGDQHEGRNRKHKLHSYNTHPLDRSQTRFQFSSFIPLTKQSSLLVNVQGSISKGGQKWCLTTNTPFIYRVKSMVTIATSWNARMMTPKFAERKYYHSDNLIHSNFTASFWILISSLVLPFSSSILLSPLYLPYQPKFHQIHVISLIFWRRLSWTVYQLWNDQLWRLKNYRD